jgi:predicted metal-dependent peptidase
MFYASILLSMKVVITDQIWIAGISNDTLYMNPRFVLGASKEDLFNAKKQLEETLK